MRILALCCAVAVLAACSPDEQPATDSIPAPVPAVAQGDVISLDEIAGDWTVRTMPEAGDSTLTTFELSATGETTGWTVAFPGREPMPVQVTHVEGDSIVLDFGTYESALRPGVTVHTVSTTRLQDGKMVGTFVARYANAGADSVLHGRTEGTRKPM